MSSTNHGILLQILVNYKNTATKIKLSMKSSTPMYEKVQHSLSLLVSSTKNWNTEFEILCQEIKKMTR